jgi:hypothetical protein
MRAWIDEEQITDSSRLLDILITSVSKRTEVLLNRHAEATSRTVYADISPAEQVIWVKGYPITSVTSVIEDATRNFTGSAVSTDDYDLTTQAMELGRIDFDFNLQEGASSVQIIYTGGMAASASAFITAFPDIAQGVEAQVYFNWKNKGMVGLDALGGGQVSGGVRRQVNQMTWWGEWGDIIPELAQAIMAHRSPAMLRRV